MCWIVPSNNIVQTQISSAQIKLSTSRAGEIFWLESPDAKYSQYYIDNLQLTRIADTKFLGAISLYSNDTAMISAFAPLQKRFLQTPTQEVLFAPQSIKTKSLHNPAAIRIPATFFDNLEKIESSQIEDEKKLIKSTITQDTPSSSVCMETQYPIRSVRTSKFGSYRRLPNGKQYFHTGLDLRAATGTPIYAMSDGVVALAQKFVISGNAVIIDHGDSLFSKYFHMSEFAVKPGQHVKKGDLLGKSGGTGRVEAPHLHWEVSWKGIPSDPVAFMGTMKSLCL